MCLPAQAVGVMSHYVYFDQYDVYCMIKASCVDHVDLHSILMVVFNMQISIVKDVTNGLLLFEVAKACLEVCKPCLSHGSCKMHFPRNCSAHIVHASSLALMLTLGHAWCVEIHSVVRCLLLWLSPPLSASLSPDLSCESTIFIFARARFLLQIMLAFQRLELDWLKTPQFSDSVSLEQMASIVNNNVHCYDLAVEFVEVLEETLSPCYQVLVVRKPK